MDCGSSSTITIGASGSGAVSLSKTGVTTAVKGDLQVEDGVVTFGDASTNGSGRLRYDSNTFYFEKRVTGSWVSFGTMELN